MTKLFLLTQIDGTQIAISSEIVESVVSVGEIVAVPRTDPVVAGLFALRSRVLTLIDCQYRVTGKIRAVERGMLAVVASAGAQSFGLLVDKVLDVVSVDETKIFPAIKLDARWEPLIDRLVEIDNNMVMVLDPERLWSIDVAMAA
jgi:purine-binding chemotaxis protein CheW